MCAIKLLDLHRSSSCYYCSSLKGRLATSHEIIGGCGGVGGLTTQYVVILMMIAVLTMRTRGM